MLITTTAIVEGRPVAQYLGIVTGEAILGANVFRDIGAMLRDITGGHAAGYEKELRRARDESMGEMEQEAAARGADAFIGVDLHYETVGNSMLMVTSYVTAVELS